MEVDFHADQQPIVRSVIERYFNAIDRRDYALLATCFTQDVDFEFNLGTRIAIQGREALIARMSAIPRPAASSHALSNTAIDIDADGATAVTFAVVHVILGQIDGGKVLVRGIRYDDRLVREDGGWRIASRRHNPLWQYETVATLPRVPERP
jgi:ketosteroid isomerase-like protein